MITLVLGGARSGKSEVAESLAARSAGTESAVVYVATGTETDDEMAARIAAHRSRRPPQWTTVECGADLVGAIRDLSGDGAPVLVDSLGTWVAATDDLDAEVAGLLDALTRRAGDTVVVSEEVGLGVHPASEAGRRFRDVLGEVNRAVAGIADDVLLVVAGRVLPLQRP